DAAAEALEVSPLPDQARKQIGELGELDLELALGGARPLGEDVEDQRGTVDRLEAESLREVTLLHGSQRIVADHEGRAGGARRLGDLLDFAAAEEERGRGGAALLYDAMDYGGSGCRSQAAQLVQRLLDFPPPLSRKPERGDHGALLHRARDL